LDDLRYFPARAIPFEVHNEYTRALFQARAFNSIDFAITARAAILIIPRESISKYILIEAVLESIFAPWQREAQAALIRVGVRLVTAGLAEHLRTRFEPEYLEDWS
jgi:hypothetical protein